MIPPILLLLLAAALPAAADPATDPFPPPTPAEIAGVLDKGAWTRAVVVLPPPAARKEGVIQPRDGALAFRRAETQKDETAIPLAEVQAILLAKPNLPAVPQAEARIAARDFAGAAAIIAEAEKKAKLPYLAVLRVQAANGRKRLDAMTANLKRLARDGGPSEALSAITTLGTSLKTTRLPPDLAAVVEQAWKVRVAKLSPDERKTWIADCGRLGVTLSWDEKAPQYLADARAAAAAGDWAKAAPAYLKADAANAGLEEGDLLRFGQALLETGKAPAARSVFWRCSAATRARADQRPLLVKAGVLAPPFALELLTLTWAGGAGDQVLNQVAFAADGTITASATGDAFTVRYAADGVKCLGIAGKTDAACASEGRRNLAVQLTKTNPFDQTEWQVGYKQVSGNLQQPYLFSPHGWHWWKWWYSICNPKQLMADSRGIDLWFPSPSTFLVWAWADGGNTTIDRDPRDLEQPNRWTKGYYGGGSKFMLGDQKSGEPIAGFNVAGRPRDAQVDAFGNLYIAGRLREGGGGKVQRLAGANDDYCLIIANPDLGIEALVALGQVEVFSIAVRGNLLALAGKAGRPASTAKDGTPIPAVGAESLAVRNPAQPKAGGGCDGVLAIIRLW